MTTKRAKILTDEQFENLRDIVAMGLNPKRDAVILAMSFKCGLRSKEIAGLRWSDVLDATGNLIPAGGLIELSSSITKGNKSDTKVFMHPMLREALENMKSDNAASSDTIIQASRGGVMSPNNVTVYLFNMYRKAGLQGCSSHTGRRTFGTNLARKCNTLGGSIADVQELLRHADIRTTRAYIDPSDTQKKLIMAL